MHTWNFLVALEIKGKIAHAPFFIPTEDRGKKRVGDTQKRIASRTLADKAVFSASFFKSTYYRSMPDERNQLCDNTRAFQLMSLKSMIE